MNADELISRVEESARLLSKRPDLLNAQGDDELIFLMDDFAGGRLTGKHLAVAQRLIDEDSDARAIFEAIKAISKSSSTWDVAERLTELLLSFYTHLLEPGLFAEGKNSVLEKLIEVDGVKWIIRSFKRPDGQYDTDFVIPEAFVTDPDMLTRLEIQVGDYVEWIRFERRDSGEYVASYVLPAANGETAKQIRVVSKPFDSSV